MSNRSNWGKPEIRAVNRTDNYRNLNNPEIGTDAAANDSSKNSPTARKKPFLCYIQDKIFQGNPISDGTLQIPLASIETITLEKIQ